MLHRDLEYQTSKYIMWCDWLSVDTHVYVEIGEQVHVSLLHANNIQIYMHYVVHYSILEFQ